MRSQKDLAEGFALRLAQRLMEMGYIHPRSGKPDVYRFAYEKRWKHAGSFYIWLYGRRDRDRPSIPRWPDLVRLAKDLGVSPAWLLVGESRKVEYQEPWTWTAEDG